ncbi:MAG: T9SS type A sorting domain-containing protein [Bacteroidota bacterium]
MKKYIYILAVFIPSLAQAQYLGTGVVTQGGATTITSNLYSCTAGRIAGVGTITATDNSVWTVPALVNFTNTSFPFASNLHNACTGATYATSAIALTALSGTTDVIVIDPAGEIITAYIFADNYFEMYINGIAVGKDNVPFTQFNSNIVRFKVIKPFTIAMLLVDWEENLGLGSENNNGFSYHPGDGGMVAVFKDAADNIIATTGSNWKAQTFYTSPITNLSCPTESGTSRLSSNCSTADSNNGTGYYGLHWNRPANCFGATFNDSSWPSATVYSNATVGVSNKPSYTNFANIFDDVTNDAQFIWSTNVILDNEVIVRYTVSTSASLFENKIGNSDFNLFPNPTNNVFEVKLSDNLKNYAVKNIELINLLGETIFKTLNYKERIDVSLYPTGIYTIKLNGDGFQLQQKLIIK